MKAQLGTETKKHKHAIKIKGEVLKSTETSGKIGFQLQCWRRGDRGRQAMTTLRSPYDSSVAGIAPNLATLF